MSDEEKKYEIIDDILYYVKANLDYAISEGISVQRLENLRSDLDNWMITKFGLSRDDNERIY